MDFFHSIGGMIRLELVSAAVDSTVLILNAQGIVLLEYHLLDPLTARFRIRRTDLDKTRKICSQLGGNIRILSRSGLYWTIRSVLKRPVLLAGITAVAACYLYIPSRILFVRTEGNVVVPTKKIIEEAESCGVRFGTSRKEIRSEQVKNGLLEKIPELQWVGVNTCGCVAVISVRERHIIEPQTDEWNVSSLYASCDGYVINATATKGTLMVQPGSTVKAGQLLISGYTDCGIAIRAAHAEGEVFAQSTRDLTLIMPLERVRIKPSGVIRKKMSLLLGKKRIFLWKDSGISMGSCGRMYEEYYITLPGGFSLPVALCIETYPEYVCGPDIRSSDSLYQRLTDAAQNYLNQQMIGGTILDVQERFTVKENVLSLSGTYVCQELISRVRMKEIGEMNGKSD